MKTKSQIRAYQRARRMYRFIPKSILKAFKDLPPQSKTTKFTRFQPQPTANP